MTNDLDVNKIAGQVVTDLIKDGFNSVSSGLSTWAIESWRKIFEDFEPLMENSYKKITNVRILCQKERDVNFSDVYVQSSFRGVSGVVSDDDLIFLVTEGSNIIVNGNGGAGKTFFMRQLWLTLFQNSSSSKIPLFIELRHLSDLTQTDLATYLKEKISDKLTDELFKYFCENGRFYFLLDGFDEVERNQREILQKQILEFSSKYIDCRFVVSSRYEKRFAGWQYFDVYDSCPFNLEQVRELVSKVPFDKEAKEVFQSKLDENFFIENESFLSNPLLAIMMLMTFRENMDIPQRMNNFYDQAFTTLYQWHDATKAYSRSKVLAIDEFQSSFGMFCLLSYYRQMYEFSRTDLVDIVKQSNQVCGINEKPEEIIRDYEESVNLIRQDGLRYVFIHRSFQEYFSAYALVRIIPRKFMDFVEEIKSRTSDSVLNMCFEMNKSIVIDEYIKPELEKYTKYGLFDGGNTERFQSLSKSNVQYRFLKKYIKDRNGKNLRMTSGLGVDMNENLMHFVDNVLRLCGRKTDSNISIATDTVLLHPDLFDVLEKMEIGIEEEYTVHVKFQKHKFSIFIEDGDGEKVSEEKVPLVEEIILSNISIIYEINQILHETLIEVREWCVLQVRESEKRVKTIDQILGI